jgi:hypothetical protein
MIANRIRQMYAITAENVALDMDRVTAAYERLYQPSDWVTLGGFPNRR